MHSTIRDTFYQNEIHKNQKLLDELSSNDQTKKLDILQLQSLHDELSEKSVLSEDETKFLEEIKKGITIFKSIKLQELDVLYGHLSEGELLNEREKMILQKIRQNKSADPIQLDPLFDELLELSPDERRKLWDIMQEKKRQNKSSGPVQLDPLSDKLPKNLKKYLLLDAVKKRTYFPDVTEKFSVEIPGTVLPEIQKHYKSKIERLHQFNNALTIIEKPPLDHFKEAVAEKLKLKALESASQVTVLTKGLDEILPFNLQPYIKNLDEILIQNYLVMPFEEVKEHMLEYCKDEKIKLLIKEMSPENLFHGMQLQQQINKKNRTQSELLTACKSALISDQNALMQLYRHPSIQVSPLSVMNKTELNKFKKMMLFKGKKLTIKNINEFLSGTRLGRTLGFTSIPTSITNDEISKIMSHYTKRFSNIYRLVELRLRNNNPPPLKEKPNSEAKRMFYLFSMKGEKPKESPSTSQKKQKPKLK